MDLSWLDSVSVGDTENTDEFSWLDNVVVSELPNIFRDVKNDPTFGRLLSEKISLQNTVSNPATVMMGDATDVQLLSDDIENGIRELMDKYGLPRDVVVDLLRGVDEQVLLQRSQQERASLAEDVGFVTGALRRYSSEQRARLEEQFGTELPGLGQVAENAFALLNVPQQVLFQPMQQIAEAKTEIAELGGSPGMQVRAAFREVPSALANIDVSYLFDPDYTAFSPEQNVEFGEILEANGLKNPGMVRFFGFAGDILIDPLLAGLWTRGFARLAKGAEAVPAGLSDVARIEGGFAPTFADRLDNIGRTIDRLLSPEGWVAGSRAAAARNVPPEIRDLAELEGVSPSVIERGLDDAAAGFNGLLNFLGPDASRLPRVSVGETLLPSGRNVLAEGGALTGGAGREPAILAAQSRAAYESDRFAASVGGRLEELAEIVGLPRVQSTMRKMLDAVRNKISVYRGLDYWPTEFRNQFETLTSEVAEHYSPLRNDDVMQNLRAERLRPDRAGSLAPSVGEELDQLADLLPKASNVLYRRNLERVVRLADEYGLDAQVITEAFDRTIRLSQENSALIGWMSTGIDMWKPQWFENAAALGATPDIAQNLFERAFILANEEFQSVAMKEALAEARVRVPRTVPQAQKLMSRIIQDVNRAIGDDVSGPLRSTSVTPTRVGETSLGEDALAMIQYLNNQMTSRNGLSAMDFFRGLGQGHLRRTYAINTPEVGRFIRSVKAGNTMSNRLLDETLYSDALEGVVDPRVQDLISRYVNNVSPSDSYGQGFIISQTDLIRFLRENGVSAPETQRAMAAIVRAMRSNDQGLDYIARQLQNIADKWAGAGPSTDVQPQSVGSLAFQPRREVTMEDLRILNEERLVSRPGRKRRVRELVQGTMVSGESEALDPDALSMLGQIYTRRVGMTESTRIARGAYPFYRFIDDVATEALKVGAALPGDTPLRNVPNIFRKLQGPVYGRLNGYYVDPWIKKELDNAIRAGSADNNFTRTWSRIRSATQGAFLTAVSTINTNIIGGAVAVGLDGHNIPDVLARYARNWANTARLGGMEYLEHYDDIADILTQTNRIYNDLVAQVEPTRIEALGPDAGIGAIINETGHFLNEVYNASRKLMEAPFGRRVPVGLNTFTMSENMYKYALYEKVLEETGDKAVAYAVARNVVFDYSSLGGAFRTLSDTGLAPFISFPVFMTERVIKAAYSNPQALALADNVHDAIWNAQFPDDDVRNAAYLSLEDWQRAGRAVPFGFNPETGRFSTFLFNDLVPIRPQVGENLIDSLTTGGFQGGLLEFANAILTQNGEAILSEEYGNTVIEETAVGNERMQQALTFLLNSYMPAAVRKLIRPPGAGDDAWQGLLPAMQRYFTMEVSNPEQYALMQYQEALRTGRMNRNMYEEAITFGLRSVQPQSLNPALNPVIQGTQAIDYQNSQIANALLQEINEIADDPNMSPEEKSRNITSRVQRLIDMDRETDIRFEIVNQGIRKLRELNQGSR